ncbi:MAG: ATP-binding cassette domain-containing protein [Acidimicrobiia bacterium]|nr:ATP-binding cassette domain-containing protein [Acidimicrobiia bacterium]
MLALVVPGGFALTLASGVPFTLLGERRRLRGVALGTASGALVVTLLSGPLTATYVAEAALYGAVVGAGLRRGWRLPRTLAVSVLTVWPVLAGALLAFLALFPETRDLVFEQVRIIARGFQNFVGAIVDAVAGAWTSVTCGSACAPAEDVIGTKLVAFAEWGIDRWPVTVPAVVLVGVVFRTWFTRYLAHPLARRMRRSAAAPDVPSPPESDVQPAPVPATLSGVSVRWPGAAHDAISDVDVEIRPHEFTGLVGDNGSGKSTLVSVLAGMPPTRGRVTRPGPVGMGRIGGTVRVFQRPESQVLGVTVADDLTWGMTPERAAGVDTAGLLDRVGLSGLADRETSTLSGGELARLAIASSIAHEPALLLSDESTAMLDRRGRATVARLLGELATQGITVVHVTHELDEVGGAGRVVRLENGRIVPPRSATSNPPGQEPAGRAEPDAAGAPLVRMAGVGYVHAAGTPWAHRALEGVDLEIRPRERLLVTGPNGAGKSTLAWILTGLLTPTEGEVVWSRDVTGRRDAVLAFQHARLQLFRPTVREDMALGVDATRDEIDAALHVAGFDPDTIGTTPIDRLSVGQQRRVAVAGLLLHRPRLLVLDEPLAGLDRPARLRLVELLTELHLTSDIATLVISHDLDDAPRIADRLLTVDGGRITRDSPLTHDLMSTLQAEGW